MNFEIFQTLFGRQSVANALISSSESSDEIGVVLRMHLVTESFLEAFICAAVNNADMFSTESTDKVVLRLNYQSKLGLALKLGLPLPAYKAMERLNTMRNKLAHRIENELIDEAVLESLSTYAKSIQCGENHRLSEEGAEFFNADGSSRSVHKLSDPATPNRIKLMIIISALIRRATKVSFGV